MDPIVIASLILAGSLLLLLASGVWVALALLSVGMVLMGLFTTAPMEIGRASCRERVL